jgi:hypothetical protein
LTFKSWASNLRKILVKRFRINQYHLLTLLGLCAVWLRSF